MERSKEKNIKCQKDKGKCYCERCRCENYENMLVGRIFKIVDTLTKKSNYILLKNNFSDAITNSTTRNIFPSNTFFYDYTSTFLYKNLRGYFKKKYPLNIQFKVYNSQQFLYNESFLSDPNGEVLFFSRTQEELNYMPFNFKISEKDVHILNRKNYSHNTTWNRIDNIFWRYDGEDVISFSLSLPEMIQERAFTTSTYQNSNVDSNQPQSYNNFNNPSLIKKIPNSFLKIAPNSLSITMFRKDIPATRLSPRYLNKEFLKLTVTTSALITLPFTFGYNNISHDLEYLSISTYGFSIAYFAEMIDGKHSGNYSIFSYIPGGIPLVNPGSSFSKMISTNNFIRIIRQPFVNFPFAFSNIQCDSPQLIKGMPDYLKKSSSTSSTNTNTTSSLTTLISGLQCVNYAFNVGSSTSTALGTNYYTPNYGNTVNSDSTGTVPAYNVYTIIGNSQLMSDGEPPSGITPGFYNTTVNYVCIGAGGAGGIYLTTSGIPAAETINEPGGNAGGVVTGSIKVGPIAVNLGALVGTGGQYYVSVASDSDFYTDGDPGQFYTGTCSDTSVIQTGTGTYVFNENMVGTVTQLQVYLPNPSTQSLSVAGYVNAYGGQPGFTSLYDKNGTSGDYGTYDNNLGVIWGPVFYYNSDYATSTTDNYVFSEVSGAAAYTNTLASYFFSLTNPTSYYYPNNGASGGAIYGGNTGTNITGIAAGYWQNSSSVTEITSPQIVSSVTVYTSENDITGIVYDIYAPFGGGGGGNTDTSAYSPYSQVQINTSSKQAGASIYGGGPGAYCNSDASQVWQSPSSRPSNATSYGGGGGGSAVFVFTGLFIPTGQVYFDNNKYYFNNGDGYQGCVILSWEQS